MVRMFLCCALLVGSWRLVATETSPAPAPAPAASELTTKDEVKEIDAVVAAAIAAGFPDAAKSTLYVGKIVVTATFDPDKDPSPLPISFSTQQVPLPNSTAKKYAYTIGGLHFKLADGTWLIALSYRLKLRDGDGVDTSEAIEQNAAELTAAGAKARPFDAETNAAKWLDALEDAQRSRAAASMNILGPVTFYLQLRPDTLAPALLLLHQAGWPDMENACLSLADQRARSYWQLRPWGPADVLFDPTGEYPRAPGDEENWKKAHPKLTPEPPQTALRRALFRWSRAQLTNPPKSEGLVSAATAAAIAKGAVDPGDEQGNAAKIDSLLVGAKLPAVTAKDADLAGKLQSWEAEAPRTRGKSATLEAYEPSKKDLDALVALLDDERPSRFFDFSGARTVGDNAWRALALLLKGDPRTLAGYPADKPWTPAERHSAAVAVQQWWKEHRGEYIEK